LPVHDKKLLFNWLQSLECIDSYNDILSNKLPYAFVCDAHFKSNDFIYAKEGLQLKPTAVPTIRIKQELEENDYEYNNYDSGDTENDIGSIIVAVNGSVNINDQNYIPPTNQHLHFRNASNNNNPNSMTGIEIELSAEDFIQNNIIKNIPSKNQYGLSSNSAHYANSTSTISPTHNVQPLGIQNYTTSVPNTTEANFTSSIIREHNKCTKLLNKRKHKMKMLNAKVKKMISFEEVQDLLYQYLLLQKQVFITEKKLKKDKVNTSKYLLFDMVQSDKLQIPKRMLNMLSNSSQE